VTSVYHVHTTSIIQEDDQPLLNVQHYNYSILFQDNNGYIIHTVYNSMAFEFTRSNKFATAQMTNTITASLVNLDQYTLDKHIVIRYTGNLIVTFKFIISHLLVKHAHSMLMHHIGILKFIEAFTLDCTTLSSSKSSLMLFKDPMHAHY